MRVFGMRMILVTSSIAVIATAALVGAALSTHPQGNIARVAPFAAAVALVWLLAIFLVGGARPAALSACLVALSASLAVLGYLLWIEPIPYAECDVLGRELRNSSCRAHASTGFLFAAGTTAAGSVAMLALVRRRSSQGT
jgi:hypothetical protein